MRALGYILLICSGIYFEPRRGERCGTLVLVAAGVFRRLAKPVASTANYKFVPTKASFFQGCSISLSSRHVLGRSLGVLFVGRPV